MKKFELYQGKKQRVESTIERIEQVKRIALKKLGVRLSTTESAKITMDSLIKQAKEFESMCKNWKKTRKDVALNEASRLYAMADSISRNYQV